MKRNLIIDISEIFVSLQGEGTRTGEPFIFIRLAGCSIKCKWCDTRYAWKKGKKMKLSEVFKSIKRFKDINSVLITGGEPLEQRESVIQLMKILILSGYEVFLETNGTMPLTGLPPEVIVTMDIKPPSSGVSDRLFFPNIDLLRSKDEVKFVIADRRDFDWAVSFINNHRIRTNNIFFSAADNLLKPQTLAKWILSSNIKVRLMLRLHKILNIK